MDEPAAPLRPGVAPSRPEEGAKDGAPPPAEETKGPVDYAAMVTALLTAHRPRPPAPAGEPEPAPAGEAEAAEDLVRRFVQEFMPPKPPGMFAGARRCAIEAMVAMAGDDGHSFLGVTEAVVATMAAISAAPSTVATGPATMCLVASFQTVAKAQGEGLGLADLKAVVLETFEIVVSENGAKTAKKALGKLCGCLCDLAGLARREEPREEEAMTQRELRDRAKHAIDALMSRGEFTAAVQLAEGAGVLGRNVQVGDMLGRLFGSDKVEAAAMLLENATAFEDPAAVREGKKALVAHLLERPEKAGHAMHYIQRYGLESEFPESLHQRTTEEVTKLMGKGKLPIAMRLATKKGTVDHRRLLVELYLAGGGTLEAAHGIVREWQAMGKFPEDLAALGDDPGCRRLVEFVRLTTEYSRMRLSLETQIKSVRDAVEANKRDQFLHFADFRGDITEVFRSPIFAGAAHEYLHAMQLLQHRLEAAKQRGQVPIFVGIDTESRFVEYGRSDQRPALLQIAYAGQVILFDLVPGRSPRAPERMSLEGALARLLMDPAIVLVGIAVQDDVRGLLRAVYQGQALPFAARVLDLEKANQGARKIVGRGREGQDVDAIMLTALRDELPQPSGMLIAPGSRGYDPDDALGGGLNGLCQRYLGKKLIKWQQLTDWEQRPLTIEQVEYATLDALVAPSILEQIAKVWTFFGGDIVDLMKLADPLATGTMYPRRTGPPGPGSMDASGRQGGGGGRRRGRGR